VLKIRGGREGKLWVKSIRQRICNSKFGAKRYDGVPSCSTATFNFRFFFDFHSGPTKVSASRAELKRQLNRNEKKKRRNGTGAVAVAVRSKEGGGGVEQVSAGVCVACGQSESGAATENRKKVRARTGTQCCGKVCAPQTLHFQTFKLNP